MARIVILNASIKAILKATVRSLNMDIIKYMYKKA